jgi:hypothetical protein
MSRRWATVLVCALATGGFAHATNWVTVWEATGTYNLTQVPPDVEITSAGIFKMQATGDYDGLGIIRSITVDPNVTGTVDLYVVDPNDAYGAWDVRLLNLSGDADTRIMTLRVANALGQDGPAVTGTRARSRGGGAPGWSEKQSEKN